MKFTTRTIVLWLFLGPVLAFPVSLTSWHVLHYFSPDKLTGLTEMIDAYPMGLLMSVMAPWGWLMYGGLFMMISKRQRLGLICTAIGATLLGVFWPVWSTFLVSTQLCRLDLQKLLDWPEEQTVGTHIDISHVAATPPGLEVTGKVKLKAVGRGDIMKILILPLMLAVLSACDRGEDNYTLYKSSVGRDLDRNEVARFNVKRRIVPDYNLGHCEKAAELFQNQQGTAVEFWCEPGNDFFIR